MRFKFHTPILFAVVLCASVEEAAAIDQLGIAIPSYQDTCQNIRQPSGGLLNVTELWCRPGEVTTLRLAAPTFLMINLANYSGKYAGNKSGVDIELDSAFFESLRSTLEYARQSGGRFGIRFRYDASGVSQPEPEWDMLVRHFESIRDSGILAEFVDVITWCELGTLGQFGEQHSSRWGATGYSTELIDIYLGMLPESIPILLRTTGRITAWVNEKLGTRFDSSNIGTMAEVIRADYATARNSVAEYYSGDGKDFSTGNLVSSDLARLGIYNDGYMGTNYDYGTFSNREQETMFLNGQGSVPYGGEYSGDHYLRMYYAGYTDVWWPQNSIPEMFYTHVNYLHSGPWKTSIAKYDFLDTEANATEERLAELLQSAQTATNRFCHIYEELGLEEFVSSVSIEPVSVTSGDVAKKGYRVQYKAPGFDDLYLTREVAAAVVEKSGYDVDLEEYIGQDLHSFISQHVGYRPIVRRSQLYIAKPIAGADFALDLDIENTGFAAPEKPADATLIVRSGSYVRELPLEIDVRSWLPGKHSLHIDGELPADMPDGRYETLVRIALEGSPVLKSHGCIRFVNDGVFDEASGANLVAKFSITSEEDIGNGDVEDDGIFEDGRPFGSYYTDAPVVSADAKVDFLREPFIFNGEDLFGYTVMFSLSGVPDDTDIRISRWSTEFDLNGSFLNSDWQLHAFNYFFKYKKEGQSTDSYGAKLTGSGTYLMYCPFYSVSGSKGPTEEGKITKIRNVICNDPSTPREDKNCPSDLAQTSAMVRPLGIFQGAASYYDVTFHAPDRDYRYADLYSIASTNAAASERVSFTRVPTIASLYNGPSVEPRRAGALAYPFEGWSMKQGVRAHMLDPDAAAIGTVHLYPIYSQIPVELDPADAITRAPARPDGVYYRDEPAVAADQEIQFLKSPYFFANTNLCGYTIMFRLDGVPDDTTIRLARWSTSGTSSSGSQLHSFNYFFRYKKAGESSFSYGAALTGSGTYLMYCPLYSVGAYRNLSDSDTHVSTFVVNNPNTGSSDKDSLTDLAGTNASIKPLGIFEGAAAYYDVIFHTPSRDLRFRDEYNFANTNRVVTENVQFRKVLSIAELAREVSVADKTQNGLVWRFEGWEVVEDGKAPQLVDVDAPAVGTMHLYPRYRPDCAASRIDGYCATLDADNRDSCGIKFTLDPATGTAKLGDGSAWQGNSGMSESGTANYVVPAYVQKDGIRYKVDGISSGALAKIRSEVEIWLPASLCEFANASFIGSEDTLLVHARSGVSVDGISTVEGDRYEASAYKPTAPMLTIDAAQEGGFRLSVPATEDAVFYVLEYAEVLDGEFSPLTSDCATGAPLDFDVTSNSSSGFFRIRATPLVPISE